MRKTRLVYQRDKRITRETCRGVACCERMLLLELFTLVEALTERRGERRGWCHNVTPALKQKRHDGYHHAVSPFKGCSTFDSRDMEHPSLDASALLLKVYVIDFEKSSIFLQSSVSAASLWGREKHLDEQWLQTISPRGWEYFTGHQVSRDAQT